MGEFSVTHLLLIALIFLIFFGPSRLPQLGQSLGKAIRGFKQGLSEIDVDAKDIHDNTQVAQKQNGGQLNNTTTTTTTQQTTTQTETPQKQTNHQS